MEFSTRSFLSIAGGLSSYTPLYRLLIGSKRGGATDDPAYCLSVWLRHYENWLHIYPDSVPGNVAEIGPGTTIGIGLCALVCGARSYTGLDVATYKQGNFWPSFLQELDLLFADKTYRHRRLADAITSHPKASAYIDDLALKERSVTAFWQQIQANGHRPDDGALTCRFFAPWTDSKRIEPNTIELLFSQSVLEHVDDLPTAYAAGYRWLRPGGVASHWIDFKSHGHSAYWNGHWAMPDWEWSLHRGRKLFLLNREPLSVHLRLIENAGFGVIHVRRKLRPGGIVRPQLAPRFRNLDEQDFITAGAEVVATKSTRDSAGQKPRPFTSEFSSSRDETLLHHSHFD